jgi:prolipoprotein diacylglyceryltransferase
VLAGAFRFALEFIRINERVALGMSLAQWGSLALVAVGAVLAVVESRR